MKQSEVQERLDANLKSALGDKLIPLPPHAWRECGLTYGVAPQDALEVFRALRDDKRFLFNMLIDLTVVDWLDKREERFDVVYQLLSITFNYRLCIKVAVGEEKPEVPSVRPLWPAANFMEREAWDMYGVSFTGHGDLRRILLYDEFVGYPLRKDYPLRGKQPRVPLRIPELRNTSGDMIRHELVALPSRKKASQTNAN